MEKHHRNGEVTYHHQLLGAALVCPGHKEVIPLMPEPILKQDGERKNDCERNALKRFLPKFRQDHPHFADRHTGCLIRQYPRDPRLAECVDPVDHSRQAGGQRVLVQTVRQLAGQGLTEEFEGTGSDGVYRRYRLAWNVPLNE